MTSATVLFVAILAATVATIASVVSVLSYFRTSQLVTRVRSTVSMQSELLEIRDYVGKLDAWSKRIAMRDAMRERRDAAQTNEPAPPRSSTRASGGPISKDELRRIAGIVPGRPTQHTE